MTYRVIADFEDLQDERYRYYPGDIFPREGKKVSKKRLAELAGEENKQGKPLIEAKEE